MIAEDPLGEVKNAIVAIGKLPEGVSGSGAEPYLDGADVEFGVEGTDFIYAHTPLEQAAGKSEPDPDATAVPKMPVDGQCEDVIFFRWRLLRTFIDIDLLRALIFFLVGVVPQG